jgi:hypothetical protein
MHVDPFHLTAQFNTQICGLPTPGVPSRLNSERKSWTVLALMEETKEFQESNTLEDEVDALIDLIYFAAGRMQEMGVDGARAFQAVHDANMRKCRGSLSKRPGSKGHDAIKPPGWVGPNYDWLRLPNLHYGLPVRKRGESESCGFVIDMTVDGNVTVFFNEHYHTYRYDELEVMP